MAMILDFHETQIAKEIGREPIEVDVDDIERGVQSCTKNAQGRYEKETLNTWIVEYIKVKKQNVIQEESLVLKKKLSSMYE